MPEAIGVKSPISFDDVVGGKGLDAADVGDKVGGKVGDKAPEAETIKVSPKTLKVLSGIDPSEIFQFLKDQKMIPKDLEMGEGAPAEEGKDQSELGTPAPEGDMGGATPPAPGGAAPISFGDMSGK